MANIPNPNLMYFHSPDLQIKIAQKSANPPNMQHHMLVFRHNSRAKKRNREKGVAISSPEPSPPFKFQDPAPIRDFEGTWTHPTKPKGPSQPPRARNCLAETIRETPERTNNPTPIFCAYLGKYFKQKKKFCSVKLATIMTTARKKLYGQNLGLLEEFFDVWIPI